MWQRIHQQWMNMNRCILWNKHVYETNTKHKIADVTSFTHDIMDQKWVEIDQCREHFYSDPILAHYDNCKATTWTWLFRHRNTICNSDVNKASLKSSFLNIPLSSITPKWPLYTRTLIIIQGIWSLWVFRSVLINCLHTSDINPTEQTRFVRRSSVHWRRMTHICVSTKDRHWFR